MVTSVQNDDYDHDSTVSQEAMESEAEITGTIETVEDEGITWKQNEDGTYTFTNNCGDENTVYAWYVLDDTDEPIYKTSYSTSSEFTYDLNEDQTLTIKSFYKTDETDKKTIKITSLEVLGEADSEIGGGITWIENEDGTYTFTNKCGGENTLYAWYVLDDSNEPIYKTSYSTSPEFTYDLNEDRALTIKSFYKTNETDRQTVKVTSLNVLGREQIEMDLSSIDMIVIEQLLTDKVLNYTDQVAGEHDSIINDQQLHGYSIAVPVDWHSTEYSNRSYAYQINALLFLDELYKEYAVTGNEKYRDEILSYIMDWVTNNSIDEVEMEEYIWHDDGTALRVFRISYYYYIFQDYISESDSLLIETSLKEQAVLLSSDEFYTEKHNHGLHQDIALLTYALLLDNTDTKEEYLSLAISRAMEYFEYVFTEDGVHKEHSPFYAEDTVQEVVYLQKILVVLSENSGISTKLDAILDNVTNYFVQLTKPNEYLPAIGDSSELNFVELCSFLSDNPQYLWITSCGTLGEAPEENFVFSEGGYGIMRSSWEDSADESVWMMLVAASFSKTHKHSDDLSFLLYYGGDVFVEAGKKDYNYSDELTTYAYSGYAHNVLLIDEEDFPVTTNENEFRSTPSSALSTGITDYDFSGEVCTITGSQERFEGVIQYRTIEYNRSENWVTVEDQIVCEDSHAASVIYHLASDITPEITEYGYILYRGDTLIAEITISGSDNCTWTVITTENAESPYYTWIFNGLSEENWEQGDLLKIDMSCMNGENNIMMKIQLK